MAADTPKYEPIPGTFREIVQRWALQAAQQLRDTYKEQRIYVEGGNPATYSVWQRPNWKRKVYKYDRAYKKGVKRRRRLLRTYTNGFSWYDENQLRRQRKQQNPDVDYWYSTGQSYKSLNVTLHDITENPEEFIVTGEVRFHATMHMLYAEAGVGKTGRKHKRAARGTDITVERSAPYKRNQRYARWTPMEGDTHRPSLRQQVNYMSRRMRWLGKTYFNYRLNTWLQVTLQSMLDTGQHPSMNIDGVGVSIVKP